MSHELREIRFDADLRVEAYRFEGIMQNFPNHFHDYYVIGFIEQGKRHVICNNEEFIVNSGDVVIFNPHDPHACAQIDGRSLDYRSLNIQPEVMRQYVMEITGTARFPRFTKVVIYHSELADSLRDLHRMICDEQPDFKKEELMMLLIEQLLTDYSDVETLGHDRELSAEIIAVSAYIDANYMRNIKLDQFSQLTGLSKYYLVRSFTREKGISPYSYLETTRINNAKRLLESGVSPSEVAFLCGFSDQSHFTKFFKKLIGLTPKQYMRVFVSEQGSRRFTLYGG
ncbi:AraC family ligand binding domain-containing protein [Paenibacillus terrigena]|uniref:AraC family ligand binding domain-containing protein n=1 Tax=Paenibacillus terrigena TaxID=369333 RepID=UPI00037ED6CC|nr:AraC family transcriptional regulator [Paenibacillus terrigena]